MDNYICINGRKAELTDNQMRILGIKKIPMEILWLQTTEVNPSHTFLTTSEAYRYKMTCPKCGRYFYFRNPVGKAMLRAHKYCGYCGNENVKGDIEIAW